VHLSRFIWYQHHHFQNNFPLPLQWISPYFPLHICSLSKLVYDVILLRVSVWSYHTQTCVSILLTSLFLCNIVEINWLKTITVLNFARSHDDLEAAPKHFLFNIVIYVFLLLGLCILIFRLPCFSALFPQLYGKCQGITRQVGARPAHFQNFCVVLKSFLLFPKFFCCSQKVCVVLKIFVLFSKFLCCSQNVSVVLKNCLLFSKFCCCSQNFCVVLKIFLLFSKFFCRSMYCLFCVVLCIVCV
jgi:hypothetical protein